MNRRFPLNIDANLIFVESPALMPPDIVISAEEMARMQRDMQEMARLSEMPLLDSADEEI